MDAKITTLRELFQKDVRYIVPPFQRPYVWNQDEQWLPLWEDVRNTAESYLDVLSDTDDPAAAVANTSVHFLGAVVAQQRLTSAAEIESRAVIDGQQRLTTLQLLLDAAQQAFKEADAHLEARRLQRLVLNDEVYVDNEPDLAFKIWPSTTDRDAFRQAMRNETTNETYEDSPIVQAHDFFREQIIEWLQNFESTSEPAQALEAVLTQLLQVVVIDLGYNDNPHVIFETLNARGTPLLDSDLIKNYMMYEASQSGSTAKVHDNILQFFEQPWWRQEVRQGRLFRPRVDVFLNYWLIMHKREEVPATRVFPAFRDYASDGSVEQIAANLERIAQVYRDLEETEGDSVLGKFLYRVRGMQAGVVSPLLMWLLSHPESQMPRLRVNRCLRAIESYLVRRMICRLSTKQYNGIVIDLLNALNKENERPDEVIVRYLGEQETEAGLWPDDHMLEDEMLSRPLYRQLPRNRLRLVLEGIEGQLHTPMTERGQPEPNLTIEHVMPRQWRQYWSLVPDLADSEEAAAGRERMIHTVGNLTLVRQRLNTSVSNGPWAAKREAIREHSVLFLNKDLLDHAGDEWDEAAIEERGRRLAALAAAAWPSADAV